MTVDYEKLLNLDYTAYDHVKDFEEKLEKHEINHPGIEVSKNYDNGAPEVTVVAVDRLKRRMYIDTYILEDVTEEEFDEVMYDVWATAMEELER